ncbi:pyridoxamine 5'-phosphate oxidase family protein [Motiliproteus sp. MSK22-1]|uniref:pyridoxamine 5'-phosphate oxidase family protein n=1 Tax=Motiliproteus sp. MSK22-1 TaxID=1897630 RepID=UPI000975F5FA|nr:pyridoxamine 5'-phosphate oxidase family protein [Motiliproteus sp. MSK22-1]OMH39503.1 flavin-nucleotide-binding protein [Motiliproteus sp. MSK22-1]
MSELEITEQTQIKRGRKRGSYNRQLIYNIIDEALVSYIGMVVKGRPFVMPTSHWRDGDKIYWHGGSKSRMVAGAENQPVCLTLALLDGLVMARSAFHHSVNYRSVMIFGTPEKIVDEAEKARQLEIFIDRVAPNRWKELRPMQSKELTATGILSMPINEASAKLRAAPPADDEQDYNWPVWAGVLPLKRIWGEAEPCPRMTGDWEAPNPPAP